MNIAEILLALTLKDLHTNTQTFNTMITIYIFLDSNVKDFSQEKEYKELGRDEEFSIS
jgi:hypothetical protein